MKARRNSYAIESAGAHRNPYYRMTEAMKIPREEYRVYDVKVFDPKGKLKEVITAEELINRPMPESDYAEHTGEEQPPQYQN